MDKLFGTDLKNLCLSLAYSEKEEEAITILKEVGYWDNEEYWRYYGDNENNFSIIGNQQGYPDAAFVEKIINSVDAMLMLKCYENNIDPESDNAPKDIKEALIKFFGIRDGKLTNLTLSERSSLAKNIIVVATGLKTNPTYNIIDKGEGQSPNRIPETFLSLTKSNKLRIPFVQGRFNQGGSGALFYCGNDNLHLIISKRCPKIINRKDKENDNSVDYWGFTIIRRENPKRGMRNSSFKYLAPHGKVLRFKADALPLLPDEYPNPYGQSLEWGSFLKLYEYKINPGLKSIICFDFYYHFSALLPNIGLPVMLMERRKGYSGDTFHTILSGLSVRLEEDKRNNLEPGFPSNGSIVISGNKINLQIYAFKKGKIENYAKEQGIIFTINGQSHGFIDRAFFSRSNVGMDYLRDSLLIIADCSDFEARIREDLFMTSRDRLRSGILKSEIEKQLEELIKNHQGLKDLKEKRRREELQSRISDDKPLKEILEKIIDKSPALSKLLLEGTRISNPFKTISTGKEEEFVGKRFPTFFMIKGNYTPENPKIAHINLRFRIQFETDAENDYFLRDDEPGEIEVSCEGIPLKDYIFNLWNGLATLTISLPECVFEDDLLSFSVILNDISRIEPIVNNFYVLVSEALEVSKGREGERKPPRGDKEGSDREKLAKLDLPNIVEVRSNLWEEYGFEKDTALKIKDSGGGFFDFFINMDNVYLLSEIKNNPGTDFSILEMQYKYSLVLIAISLIKFYRDKTKEENSSAESIQEKIDYFTKAISPVIIPIISSLGELE